MRVQVPEVESTIWKSLRRLLCELKYPTLCQVTTMRLGSMWKQIELLLGWPPPRVSTSAHQGAIIG